MEYFVASKWPAGGPGAKTSGFFLGPGPAQSVAVALLLGAWAPAWGRSDLREGWGLSDLREARGLTCKVTGGGPGADLLGYRRGPWGWPAGALGLTCGRLGGWPARWPAGALGLTYEVTGGGSWGWPARWPVGALRLTCGGPGADLRGDRRGSWGWPVRWPAGTLGLTCEVTGGGPGGPGGGLVRKWYLYTSPITTISTFDFSFRQMN